MNPEEIPVNEIIPSDPSLILTPAPLVVPAPVEAVTEVFEPTPICEPVTPDVAAIPDQLTENIQSPEAHFATPADILSQLPQSPAGLDSPVGVPNTSSPVSNDIAGWNWGAFLLPLFWSIGNQTWIGLISIISPLGIIMGIYLGLKGNELAWKNRKFESVDQFKAVQKAWTKWGLIVDIILVVLSIAAIVLYVTFAKSTVVATPIEPINLTN